MFEKEYLTQKAILFVALIFILSFSCRTFLSEKNGISAQEGQTLAISNTSENLEESPYNIAVYNTEELENTICEQPYFFSMANILKYCAEPNKYLGSGSTLLSNAKEYTNETFIENNYYTNLLTVKDENHFHYSKVLSNCISSQRPPLYYLLLHTIHSIFGSLHMFRLSFFLNIVFLFCSCFFILEIGKNYFHSSFVGLAAALLYALCLGIFSGSICSNPFVMTSFFLILSLNLHLANLKEDHTRIFLLQAIAIVNVLGNLSDYSYVLFACVIGIVYCLSMLFLGRGKDILLYIGFSALSLLVTTFFYPSILLHITTAVFTSWNQFVCEFSLETFHLSLFSNLVILGNQIFAHTLVLVILFLSILLIVAIALNKHGLLFHLKAFWERIRTGNMADFFVFVTLCTFFVGISFFYKNESYFVLLTLLPLITLLVSNLVYRLCHAATHSAFNSGLFSVLFVCVLCFLSITTSTPEYLYSENEQQLNFASQYASEYCIFLTSENLKPEDHILELQKYQHSMVLPKKRIKSLKKNKAFLNQDTIIVYASSEDYGADVVNQIAKNGAFTITTELTNYLDEHCNRIYVCQCSNVQ